jgi:hypothetical protein
MKFELNSFNRNVPDEELLQDLATADAKLKALGKKLTFRSYKKFGKYSPTTIGVRFGSWEPGIAKSGDNSERGKKCPCRGAFRQSETCMDREGPTACLPRYGYRAISIPSEFFFSTIEISESALQSA